MNISKKCGNCDELLTDDNCSIFFSDGTICNDCAIDWDQVEDNEIDEFEEKRYYCSSD